MPLSQSCSRQNSAQNAPIESSFALTRTTFVVISMFMSRSPKVDLNKYQKIALPQSCLHRNSVQNAPVEISTALTVTAFVTISVFMSRGHFPANFGQLMDSFRTACGQPLGNFWATKMGDKKCCRKSRPWPFLLSGDVLRVCSLIVWFSCDWF